MYTCERQAENPININLAIVININLAIYGININLAIAINIRTKPSKGSHFYTSMFVFIAPLFIVLKVELERFKITFR